MTLQTAQENIKTSPSCFWFRWYPLGLSPDQPSSQRHDRTATHKQLQPHDCHSCTHAVPSQNNNTDLKPPERGCGWNLITGECFFANKMFTLITIRCNMKAGFGTAGPGVKIFTVYIPMRNRPVKKNATWTKS